MRLHADYIALCARVRAHDLAYYLQAKPTIRDYEYDQLYQELLTLEQAHPEWLTPDSPSQGGWPCFDGV